MMNVNKRKRLYVGVRFRNKKQLPPIYKLFWAMPTPTRETHGHLYGAIIGPFRTIAEAKKLTKLSAYPGD